MFSGWRALSLICMLSFSFQNILVKALTRRGVRVKFIFWFLVAAAVPFLLVAYIYSAPHRFLPGFVIALFFAVLGNMLGYYGYLKAISLADVSLVMPLISLTPFFMLLTSWVMLSELPDLPGLIGIVGVVSGTYLLTRKPGSGWLQPFYALWRNPGCRWALFTSLIWSVQANIDKIAVEASTPVGYTLWFHILFSLLLLPFFFFGEFKLYEQQKYFSFNSKFVTVIIFGLIVVGGLQALMTVVQMGAIIQIQVSYVIAIKRAGMLLVVFAGGLLFEEKYLLRRLFAATVVLMGLLAILLF